MNTLIQWKIGQKNIIQVKINVKKSTINQIQKLLREQRLKQPKKFSKIWDGKPTNKQKRQQDKLNIRKNNA